MKSQRMLCYGLEAQLFCKLWKYYSYDRSVPVIWALLIDWPY